MGMQGLTWGILGIPVNLINFSMSRKNRGVCGWGMGEGKLGLLFSI